MVSFTKAPKTFEEQVELLRERGMEFADADKARHYLAPINYYRLTA